jgi:hypothetical protein
MRHGALMSVLLMAQQANVPGAPSSFRAEDGSKFKRIRDYTKHPPILDQLRERLAKVTTQQQCQELLLDTCRKCPDVSGRTRRRWRLAVLQRIAEIDRQAREASRRPLIVVPA